MKIEQHDFDVVFDPTEKKWTATWKWSGERLPKQLINQTPEYTVAEHVRKDYNCELQTLIHNGWLIPYPEKELGFSRGLIPLMVIVQHNLGQMPARLAEQMMKLQMTLGILQCLAVRQHKMEKPQNYPCDEAHAGGCHRDLACAVIRDQRGV